MFNPNSNSYFSVSSIVLELVLVLEKKCYITKEFWKLIIEALSNCQLQFMMVWDRNCVHFTADLKNIIKKKEKLCQTWQWTGYDRNCNLHYWNHVYFICDVQRVSTEFIKQISQTWNLEKSYLGIWLLDLFKKVMSMFIFIILHHFRCIYRIIKYIKAENWHALSHEKYFYNTTYLSWMRKNGFSVLFHRY